MGSGRTKVADVDAILARWRDGAGADWRATFRGRLEAHERAFEKEGNPLDAWDAVLLARALGEAPPQWAMDYLATCAAGFYDLRAGQVDFLPHTVNQTIQTGWGIFSEGQGTDWVVDPSAEKQAQKPKDGRDWQRGFKVSVFSESIAGKPIKPGEIGRVLGMVSDGAGTAFPGVDAWGWIALGTQVRDLKKTGCDETSAIALVAENNDISESKAREAWKRLEAECPELL